MLQQNNCPEIFGLFIPSSHDVVEAMVNDQRLPLISFTGSTAVGKIVAAKVASRLGKTILELGGNNAIILDESADMQLAIPAIVFGAVGTAGQRCTSTRRLFVPESKFQDMIKRLQHAYEQITIGDPLDNSNLMGPLIDQHAVEQFKQAISSYQSSGWSNNFWWRSIKSRGFFCTANPGNWH